MNFLSRKDARLIGAVRYFTGKLCKNGHIDERFVSNGSCVTCEKERRERPDNIEKERIYRAVNSEKARKRSSEWYANNQEKVKKYREDNVDRTKTYKQSDKYKESARKYERNNAERIKQYRRSSFVDGIIYYFVHQVVQSFNAYIANIHGGAFTNGLQTF